MEIQRGTKAANRRTKGEARGARNKASNLPTGGLHSNCTSRLYKYCSRDSGSNGAHHMNWPCLAQSFGSRMARFLPAIASGRAAQLRHGGEGAPPQECDAFERNGLTISIVRTDFRLVLNTEPVESAWLIAKTP